MWVLTNSLKLFSDQPTTEKALDHYVWRSNQTSLVLGNQVLSTWYQVLGAKYLVLGTKYLVLCTKYPLYLALSTKYQVLCTKHFVPNSNDRGKSSINKFRTPTDEVGWESAGPLGAPGCEAKFAL